MSAAATTLTPPALRAYWPGQGGYYAGIVSGGEGAPDYHLIVSGKALGDFRGAWGKTGKDVPGAESYFDGPANTRAMAAAGSDIAKQVLALEIEGHADWHIMSQAEAHVLAANCKSLFEQRLYWTSTQFSENYAWLQYFSYGTQNFYHKSFEARCRAVRRLPLESFNPLGGAQ